MQQTSHKRKNFGSDYAGLAHHLVYNRDYSYCYGYRMYSEGHRIFSYGSHYMIAQFVENKKGEEAVLFNSNDSSFTTNGQRSIVRSSVRHKKIFTVPGASLNHKENTDHYLREIQNALYDAKKARTKRQEYLNNAEGFRLTLKEYVEFFGLRSSLTKAEKEVLEQKIEGTDYSTADEAQEAKAKAERRRINRQNREAVKKEKENLTKWLDGEIGRLYTQYHDTAFLRINGENVETSQGARVPVREARILWERIKAGKDVIGHNIGSYTVISINGTLKIGCHVIERSEIERFVKKYNW